MTLPISNYKERIVEAVATHSFNLCRDWCWKINTGSTVFNIYC